MNEYFFIYQIPSNCSCTTQENQREHVVQASNATDALNYFRSMYPYTRIISIHKF